MVPLRAQNPVEIPAWQKAAGEPMRFEVASIREDNGPFEPPSFALSSDDWFREPNGRFHADFSVEAYITFAYKLWVTGEERDLMLARAGVGEERTFQNRGDRSAACDEGSVSVDDAVITCRPVRAEDSL